MQLSALFFFVDGLGMGRDDPALNPLFRGDCPTLARWLREEAVPLDATLDTPGLPQSATGQTSLFTGINGAKAHGGHKEGYPGPALREVIEKQNLFDLVQARGGACAFANAYYLEGLSPAELRRRRSVTTVITLKALGGVRGLPELERGDAVYNDLVRRRLNERGYPTPLISPEEAGRHLISIAEQYSLTLFEYFQTDTTAHKGSPENTARVLRELDAALVVAARFAEKENRLFLVCSDHGNIEDASTRTHTRNPVPLIAFGAGADVLRAKARSLLDVTPLLVSLYEN